MRRIIPTHWHTFFDYITALVLLVSPWILDFEEHHLASLISWLAAGLIVVQALTTNYEGGLIRVIPISVHLWFDVLLGTFLIISPFLLDFPTIVHIMNTFLGFIILGLGLFTESRMRRYEIPVRR
ncbi:hypothetical protein PQ465_11425 [Sphingobacterium oryzagri]|uniref:SPW repeat-containing integral membrane domain-containing protein n=1 Tax=Sphingobacterium oryzagri TaxID=3025669 RepID=A0ABY7WB88_9SPHI|nr:hypothetical protein [Sphingobacterium sp. KACC 22765]WDF66916.1 hypothetical protein PQ465_11425 [Sphingobacterium sp. KACC 22765]